MSLIRGLFWFALFVLFTFSFIVLFEHGTHDYVASWQKEAARATAYFSEKINGSPKKK